MPNDTRSCSLTTLRCLALSLLLAATARAQQEPIRLLVRGDDMGFTHSGNLALIRSYKEGCERSIEVIVASPWFPEAVKLLQQNPGVDIGIHLALTSEWDNLKWRPLTDCPSLRDSSGYYYPKVFPDKNYPGQSIMENKWTIADIEKEFRAQIELALKKMPGISHLSGHMGCTNMTPEVRALSLKLAREYHLLIDIDCPVTGVGYDGPSKTPAEKIQAFLKMLNGLKPGKTYLFLDHPGLDDEELRAVHHIGYEDVASDRQGVTDLFTSEKVMRTIKEKNIQLISFKDLKKY